MKSIDRISGREIAGHGLPVAVVGRIWDVGSQRSTSAIGVTSALPVDFIDLVQSRALEDISIRARDAAPGAHVAPVSSVAAELDLTELEQMAQTHIRHLEHIFWRPYARLRGSEERIPVSRARRAARRAPVELAQRTRDWADVTAGRVRPRRVLSVFTDENVDIYENRVAYFIVSRLSEIVDRRLRRLRAMRGDLEALETMLNELSTMGRLRRDRGYELVAALVPKTGGGIASPAVRSVPELATLSRSLHAMLDSGPLSVAVDQAAARGIGFYQTNLIRNDPHYRVLADLWTPLQRTIDAETESRDEAQTRLARSVPDMTDFLSVLVVDALESLGAAPDPVASLLVDRRCRVRLGQTDVDVRIDDAMVVEVAYLGRRLRLVGLPSTLRTAADKEALSPDRIGLLNDETVVFYLQERTNPEARGDWLVRQYAFSQDLPSSLRGGSALIPISPLSVLSVERVERVLLRFMTDAAWKTAQRPVRRHSSLEQPTEPGLLGRGNEVVLVGPLRGGSLAAQEAVWIQNIAKLPIARRDEVSKALHQTMADLGNRSVAASILGTCASCGSSSCQVAYRVEGFLLACDECGSKTQVATCGACHQTYLVLEPMAKPPESREEPAWVDYWAGSRLLATPCWLNPAVFICDRCGMCRDHDPVRCRRCAAVAAPEHQE